MVLHSGDGPNGQQNKWSNDAGSLPEDTIISDSTHELFEDLQTEIERSDPPTLPQFSVNTAFPASKKRDRDEFTASSSDAPLFSSDDLPSSSADNYLEERRKRQYRSPSFQLETHETSAKQQSGSLGPRTRGPFTRAFDSGVWLGSDGTTGEEDKPDESMGYSFGDLKEGEASDEESADILADLAQTPGITRRIDLVTRAMQTSEDPGNFEGPIFPFWQKQPDNLELYHLMQRAAQEKVFACVETGEEELDLSSMNLKHLRTPTMEALRYHTKQPPGHKDTFGSMKPNLGLYLSHNALDDVPSVVYHLTNLKVLSLRSNNLTEVLPAISGLTNLGELHLGGNQLAWLPWEILGLMDPSNPLHIERCTVHPNTFLRPVPYVRNIEEWNEYIPKDYKGHPASTRIAFLNITGSSHRDYAQAPSSVSEHWEKSLDIKDSIYPSLEERTKTPSLMELAIRACYKTPQLSQLPFLLPPDSPAHIKQLLESTWKLKESGGKRCSVCGYEYIIPRTEWLEWWYCQGSAYSTIERPLPFLRRGCSWQCFEEIPDVPIRGWSSSIGPGGW